LPFRLFLPSCNVSNDPELTYALRALKAIVCCGGKVVILLYKKKVRVVVG
jgi:hypothetical protein